MGDIVNKITGQDEVNDILREMRNREPVQFQGGGLRSDIRDNRAFVEATPERRQTIEGIQDVLRTGATDLRDLREGADTPLDRLRESIQASNEAALDRIANERRRAVGNIAENLQRRRVLGSSFGQDAIARARAQFAQEQAEQEAQAGQRMARTALQELDLKTELIQRETDLLQQAERVALEDMNLRAELATGVATKAEQQIQRNQELRLQAAQEEAAGMGSLVGTVVGGVAGFMLGGPAGAMAGASIGSGAMGGGGGGGDFTAQPITGGRQPPPRPRPSPDDGQPNTSLVDPQLLTEDRRAPS